MCQSLRARKADSPEKMFDSRCAIGYTFSRRERAAGGRPDRNHKQEDTNMRYVCNVCGWVYDEDEAGVKWEDLPDDFACELCGVGKEDFSPEE